MSKKTPKAVPIRPTAYSTDEMSRRTVAAKDPGIVELDKLYADAKRLALRMDAWLKKHDRPEPTATTMNMDIAFRDRDGYSDVNIYLDYLRGMAWSLRAGSQWVEGVAFGHNLPEFCSAMG